MIDLGPIVKKILLGLFVIYIALASRFIYTVHRRVKFAREMGTSCPYAIESESTRKLEIDANAGLKQLYAPTATLAIIIGFAVFGICAWDLVKTREFLLNGNVMFFIMAVLTVFVEWYIMLIYNKMQAAQKVNGHSYDSIKSSLASYVAGLQ